MVGAGSRFQKAGINEPKPLIKVSGKTLIEHSIDSFNIPGRFIFLTRDFDNPNDNVLLSNLLKEKRPESIEIKLSAMTSGATESALFAKELINNDDPLVIYNCDQLINWDSTDFLSFLEEKKPDAAVVLYNSQDPKNSFAEIKNGLIIRMVEKQVISNHALIGFHYWAKGKDFVSSAMSLMNNFRITGSPECYISETFNYLNNKTILPYHIANNLYVPLGTPGDLSKYIGKISEFNTNKPKTLFLDIDGTLLKHQHTISDVYLHPAEILPGVVKKINEWDSQGHTIILITARKESTRELTEKQLKQFGVAWNHLIMGVGGGCRYLVNDKLTVNDTDRAVSINVVTNEGFISTSWDNYGL